MKPVNIDSFCPWELELVFSGVKCRTLEPTVDQLRQLAEIERMAVVTTDDLRNGLKTFVAPECLSTLAIASHSDLEAALMTADAYFEGWQRKKRVAAFAAGLQAAGWGPDEAMAEATRRMDKAKMIRDAATPPAPGPSPSSSKPS